MVKFKTWKGRVPHFSWAELRSIFALSLSMHGRYISFFSFFIPILIPVVSLADPRLEAARPGPRSVADASPSFQEQYPQLHNALQFILDRLATAAREQYPAEMKNVQWQFRVVESSEANAFVEIADRKKNTAELVDKIEITSALLNLLASSERSGGGEDYLQKTLAYIAGIFAHEIGHSIDYSRNPYAVDNGPLKEVHADAFAIPLLRAAGFATDSLNGAFRFLRSRSKRVSGAASKLATTYISTHPSNQFRLIQGELGVVADQMTRGSPKLVSVPTQREEFLLELERFSASSEKLEPVAEINRGFETIGEIAGELNRRLAAFSLRYKNVASEELADFRALLNRMDERLRDKGAGVDEAGREAIFDFVRNYAQAKIKVPVSMSQELISVAHRAAVPHIPFYNSPEYLDFIYREFTPIFSSLMSGHESPGYETPLKLFVSDFCPPQVLFQSMRRYIGVMAQNTGSGRNLNKEEANFLAKVTGNISALQDPVVMDNLRAFPATRLYHEIADQTSAYKSTEFILQFQKQSPYEQPAFRMNHQHYGLQDPNATLEFGRRHHQVEDLEAIARSIWKRRGFYALMGLIQGRPDDVDWPLVLRVLDISPEMGRLQINESLAEFLKSPEYAEVLHAWSEAEPIATTRHRKPAETSWIDSTHWNALLGNFLQLPETLRTRARVVAMNYISGDRQAFREVYDLEIRKGLRDALEENHGDQNVFTTQNIRKIFESAFKAMGELRNHVARVFDLQIQALRDLNLPKDSLRRILTEFYLDSAHANILVYNFSDEKQVRDFSVSGHIDEVGHWILPTPAQHGLKIFKLLREEGVVPRPSEFSALIETRIKFADAPLGDSPDAYNVYQHFQVMHELAPLLGEELHSIHDPSSLLAFAARVYSPPLPAHSHRSTLVLGQPLADLTAEVIARAKQLELNREDSLRLFLSLTQNGATLATDRFYEEALRPHMLRETSAQQLHELREFVSEIGKITRDQDSEVIMSDGTVLTSKARNHDIPTPPPTHPRIVSGRLRAEIARRVLTEEMSRLSSQQRHPNSSYVPVRRLLVQIEQMTDTGTARDELIESLAWDLDVRDRAILAHLDSKKSTSWNFVSPSRVRQGSTLTEVSDHLSAAARHDALLYFMRPEGPLPASIVQSITTSILNKAKLSQDFLKNDTAQQRIGEAIRNLESAAHSASPQERIPALMLLMRSAENPPMEAADFPRNMLREYLGVSAGSNEEKVMMAYLRVIGPDEVSATVAGMMALHHQDGGGRWRPLFEVFTGVGVKAGQLTSIFNLLGPEATDELRSLRDHARPLSKNQIENIFDQTLSPAERSLIHRTVRVLGSASMKTVVLVELTDGRQVVAMVQAPHAPEQNASNLQRARAFVAELRADGISIPRFMDDIIEGTARQMVHEEHMTQEVQNTLQAQTVYDRLNETMAKDLNGWRFHVPGPIADFTARDHLTFMEYAGGRAHENIRDPQIKAHTGRMILRSGLRGFFRHGLLNADPHGGNYLIDEETRTIHPIDFGQTEIYRTEEFGRSLRGLMSGADDIYSFAQFLRAIEARNVEEMLYFGERLALANSGDSRRLVDRNALKQSLEEVLHQSSQSPNELIIGITDAFSRHRFAMEHRFSFGALKALLIYQREQFGSDLDLLTELNAEVRYALLARPGAIAVDAARSVRSRVEDCLIRLLR